MKNARKTRRFTISLRRIIFTLASQRGYQNMAVHRTPLLPTGGMDDE
ncbi:MAG: hypothetical protein U1B80_05765 [Anaerolineaceae bacterium]|nr:hypothetical protein [Anaerolineaceae bacterium]